MDKRERVSRALNLESVDRPPVGFWFHFPKEKAMGQACVQAHLDYYNNADADMAKIMCDGYFDYPNPVAKTARAPGDWRKMRPLGKNSPYVQEQVARAKAVKAGLKDDMVVLYNVFAPFSLIRFAAGDELVMDHLSKDPEAVLYALDVIAQDTAALSELLVREAGVDGAYFCVQGGEKKRFTPEKYREMIAPSELYALARAEACGGVNVLHCCGWAGIPNHMEVWKNYPAKAVNWACYVENMNLPDGRAFFGNRCVLGGFDNRPQGVLYSGEKRDVQAETWRLIAQAGKRGLILGADCTLPAGIDTARIGWVAEAAKQTV